MRSSLIWVSTVCSDLSVQIFKIFTVSVFWYQIYQAQPETHRAGSASLDIPTLFLVLSEILDIKGH